MFLGNGDGTFQPPVTYAGGESHGLLAVGDFNGDGKLDLATGFAEVSVLLGNGDGTFQPQKTFAAAISVLGMVAADFNDDGRLDLLAAGNEFNPATGGASLFLGNGDGTFQARQVAATGLGPSAIVSGDFNGDGRLDLATANSASNDISVLLGNGDGTFQPQLKFAAGKNPLFLATGDLNGDGRIDLVVVDEGTEYYNETVPGSVMVLLGNGDGTFQAAIELAGGNLHSQRLWSWGISTVMAGSISPLRIPAMSTRRDRPGGRGRVLGQRRRHLPGPAAIRRRRRIKSWGSQTGDGGFHG